MGSESRLEFITKDSGERQQFASGMVRDVTTGKSNPLLAFDGPMFLRWVGLLTRGAVKYAKRNWMKASGEEEYERFQESAVRHFFQWLNGDTDEDHAAAVFFNINGAEYVKEKMKKPTSSDKEEVGTKWFTDFSTSRPLTPEEKLALERVQLQARPVQAEQSQRSEPHPVTSSERRTEVPLVDKRPASYSR